MTWIAGRPRRSIFGHKGISDSERGVLAQYEGPETILAEVKTKSNSIFRTKFNFVVQLDQKGRLRIYTIGKGASLFRWQNKEIDQTVEGLLLPIVAGLRPN